MTTYKIVRMHREDKPNRTIARGLSLEDAQQHCKDPTTHYYDKNGNVEWFDGYDKED